MNRDNHGKPQGFQQNNPMTPEQKNEIFTLYMARKQELGKPVTKEDAIAFIQEQEGKGFGYPATKKFVQNMKY